MTALLGLEGVEAAYGESQVLWDIDFAAETGRITALVGSNGAGKTSLMRVISGLLKPTAGRVIFDGADIAKVPAEVV